MDVKKEETKLLSAPWNKTVDTIEVAFPTPIVKVTKREILRNISKIYDHLGLAWLERCCTEKHTTPEYLRTEIFPGS